MPKMYIVTVIPIIKYAFKDSLSYFSMEYIQPGFVIDVPIQKRKVPALVVSIELASKIKSVIRGQKFMTRALKKPNPRMVLSEEFIRSAQKTSKYFVKNLSSILHLYIPISVLKDVSVVKTIENDKDKKIKEKKFAEVEQFAFQGSYEERKNIYKTLIREALAKNESVVLLVPSITVADTFENEFKKGIERYVVKLHSGITPRQQKKLFKQARESEHSVLLIITKGFLGITRDDIGLYIIDAEGSDLYREWAYPYTDARILAEELANTYSAKVLYTDTVLRMKTFKNIKNHSINEYEPIKRRVRFPMKIDIININNDFNNKTKQKKFNVLSKEVIDVIKNTEKTKAHIFIHAPRRGFASVTVCRDCGDILLCDKCGSPQKLHTLNGERIFLCHTCGASLEAKTLCKNCGSWNLMPLGTGIEKIEEELKSVTKIPVFRIDSDVVKTKKQAKMMIDDFFKEQKAILLGTSIATPYLISREVDFSVITSLEAILATPDFSADTRAMRTVFAMSEFTKDKLFLQTRTPEINILKYIRNKNVLAFVEEELKIRKKLHYPPFYTFIKISSKGIKLNLLKDAEFILSEFSKFSPRVFHSLEPAGANTYILRILLRTERWPDKELRDKLYLLQSRFVVQIL